MNLNKPYKRIIILGGCGFLGLITANLLINKFYKIIIVGQYHSHVLQILISKLRKNLIMLFFINKKVNALKGYNLVLLTM